MGFFFAEETKTKKTVTRKSKTSVAEKRVNAETLHVARCNACTLNKADVIHPKMKPEGVKRADLYVLSEHPSADEDFTGTWLDGAISEDLREYIDDRVKARYFGIVRCHPEERDSPSRVETECCRKFIEEDIQRTKPKVILGLGHHVLNWLIKTPGVTDVWRGRKIPVVVGAHKCWYVPTYSPTYIQGTKRKDIKEDQYRFVRRDVQKCLKLLKRDKPPRIYSEEKAFSNVKYVLGRGEKDFQQLKEWLQSLLKEPVVAYDLETFAKRVSSKFESSVFMPFAPEARILTMSLGTEANPYAFPIDHPDAWLGKYKRKVHKLVTSFFMKYKGIIVAHNLPFDLLWTRYFFGKEVVQSNKWEDTQAQAFVLDSRKGAHSLDVLCRIYFGFNLKALTSDLNKENLIAEPLDRVLMYNGGDVKFTHKLYGVQSKLLSMEANKNLVWPYNHLCRSSKTIVEMEHLGLPVSVKALDEFEAALTKQLEDIKHSISANKDAKKFKRVTGRELNVASDTDLKDLFTKVRKCKHVHIEEDGEVKIKTDKKVLDKLNIPIANMILDFRDVSKQLGTYIVGTRNLIYPDGLLHPNINLMLTSTGRLSYDNPNGQNYPKRKNKYIRNVIATPDGEVLLAVDYGQIEARVIGMASEDQKFCEALWNDYDVHREWAERFTQADVTLLERFVEAEGITDVTVEVAMSALRSKTKNGWVFPLFFGASYYSASKAMMVDEAIGEQLYEEFWDTFGGVKKWQDKVVKSYLKKGYVETLTGRRRHGPLTINEMINTPIQGTASDIVTNAANNLYDADMCPILNVHDDLTSRIVKSGWKRRARDIASIMCKPGFDFINVPIVVEVEVAQRWGELKEYRKFCSHKDFNYH